MIKMNTCMIANVVLVSQLWPLLVIVIVCLVYHNLVIVIQLKQF